MRKQLLGVFLPLLILGLLAAAAETRSTGTGATKRAALQRLQVTHGEEPQDRVGCNPADEGRDQRDGPARCSRHGGGRSRADRSRHRRHGAIRGNHGRRARDSGGA